jgi:hypothetical protein
MNVPIAELPEYLTIISANTRMVKAVIKIIYF